MEEVEKQRKEIRQRLAREPPHKMIQSFQSEHQISSPGLQSIIPYMDFLTSFSCSKCDIHASIFSALSSTLTAKWPLMSPSIQRQSMDKLYSFIEAEPIRDLIFSLLVEMKDPPLYCFQDIATSSTFYDTAPLPLRRRIWELSANGKIGKELLRNYLIKQLKGYVSDPLIKGMNTEELMPMYALSSLQKSARRNHPVLVEMVDIIDSSISTYNVALDTIRSLYAIQPNHAYCIMRSQLLMKLHDCDKTRVKIGRCITQIEPCYKLAWYFDAFIQGHSLLEENRFREIEAFTDTMLLQYGHSNPMIGDIGMILSDPAALNVLYKTLVQILKLNGQKSPRAKSYKSHLELVGRLLLLSKTCAKMIKSQSFHFPILDSQFADYLDKIGETISSNGNSSLQLESSLLSFLKTDSVVHRKIFFHLVLDTMVDCKLDGGLLKALLRTLFNIPEVQNERLFLALFFNILIQYRAEDNGSAILGLLSSLLALVGEKHSHTLGLIFQWIKSIHTGLTLPELKIAVAKIAAAWNENFDDPKLFHDFKLILQLQSAR